jgi:hypothetical protein
MNGLLAKPFSPSDLLAELMRLSTEGQEVAA